MELYQVTFEKSGIYQVNVIETTNEESARKWYAQHKPTGVGSIIVITIIIGIIVFSVGAIWYKVKNKT